MKKQFLLLLFLLTALLSEAQFKFPVDTLVKTGAIKRRINVVILPDGYTAAELAKFKTDANTFKDYLLSTHPFKKYKPYFSFFAVNVPSNESGITHPGTANDEPTAGTHPVVAKDTYFGVSFDIGKIHRLTSYTKPTALTNVLASNFPSYDIIFILANTPFYGGAGGFAATATLNVSSNEIGVHELGHSFGGLADEYYAGAIYEREALNQSKDKNPTTNRWRNWLGTTNIGIFDHDSPGQAWAKPSKGTCRMEFLGKEFCNVCREGIAEKILSLITPVETLTPVAANQTLTVTPATFQLNLLKPEPNSLQVEWFLDGKSIATTEQIKISAASMPNTTAKLQAVVYDSTYFSRNTARKLSPYTLQWNLSRTAVEPFGITANKTTLCAGDSITLTAKSCGGTVTWSNGAKGNSIIAKPTANVSYTATCDIAGVATSNAVPVTVNALPVATASNKGPYIEYQTIELAGGGGGSYSWAGVSGFTAAIQNPSIANAKLSNAGVYTLTVTTNGCVATATTSVAVAAFALNVSDVTPQAICPNATISLSIAPNGTLQKDNVSTIQLSDNQGSNFKNLTTTADGTSLKAVIPAGTVAGTGYKVRVSTTNPAVQQVSATTLTIRAFPSASFEGSETTILQYQSADVKLKLTGDSPYKVKLGDGQTFDVSDASPNIKLTPAQTTEYKLATVSNVCGDGTVGTTTFKITVTPVLGYEPSPDGFEVYPNPTEQAITISVEGQSTQTKQISLADMQGRIVFEQSTQTPKTTINLQNLPAGTYLLKVQQGEQVMVKKVLKY